MNSVTTKIPKFLNLTTTTEHFTNYYDATLPKATLQDISETLEGEYPRLSGFFDVKGDLHIPVLIYPDRKSFHMDIKSEDEKELPDWVVGNCNSDGMVQFVDPNNALPTHGYDDILETAVHELTHSLTKLDGDRSRSAWLSEGIALFLANQKNEKGIKDRISELDMLADSIFSNNYR